MLRRGIEMFCLVSLELAATVPIPPTARELTWHRLGSLPRHVILYQPCQAPRSVLHLELGRRQHPVLLDTFALGCGSESTSYLLSLIFQARPTIRYTSLSSQTTHILFFTNS